MEEITMSDHKSTTLYKCKRIVEESREKSTYPDQVF